jgi:pectate lyase
MALRTLHVGSVCSLLLLSLIISRPLASHLPIRQQDGIDLQTLRDAARQLPARGGERWYSMRNRGERVGWLRLTTKEKDGAILLEDELFFTAKGEDARTLHTVACRPNEFLSPTSLRIKTERPVKPWTLDAAVTNGLLQLRAPFPGAPTGKESRLPPNFTTELAAVRLATIMPKSGKLDLSVFEFWEKPGVQEASLQYVRDETLDFEGGKRNVARFTLSNPHSADRTLWVDESHRLVKLQVYGRIEFVLTSEADAKSFAPSVRPTESARAPRKRETIPESAIPAFPGAEGFGSRTKAGRGGKVIEVTSLADGGPGTLRAALASPVPRTIVFRVGGTIALKSQLSIDHPFVTVAGQTAPGDGILLKNAGLVVSTHDVLIRHLRIRPGNEGATDPENNDAIMLLGAANVVVDHVSASWGEDETVSTWAGAHNVTLSWCIVSEALDKSRHPKGRHSAGVIIGDGSDRVTMHHCYLAHNDFRNPLISRSGRVDVVENVIYNWGSTAAEIYGDANSTVGSRLNLVGNVYLAGPASPATIPVLAVNVNGVAAANAPLVYVRDLRSPKSSARQADAFSLVSLGWGGSPLPTQYRSARPIGTLSARYDAAGAPTNAVLDGAGATRPRRDSVDKRVVTSSRQNGGKFINVPQDAGGYPVMRGGTPPADSDHDGMPDAWERKRGLTPHSTSDGTKDRDRDGYTNLEEYLNEVAGKGESR